MYHYQIQMQLKVCEVLCEDFVVWRKEQLLHQRIKYDSQFIEDALKKVEAFIKQCILSAQSIANQISPTASTTHQLLMIQVPLTSFYSHRVMKTMMYHLVYTLMVIPLCLYKDKMLIQTFLTWHQVLPA